MDARPMPVLPHVGSMMTEPGLSTPLRFRVVQHRAGNAILHRPGGVEIFQLRQQRRLQTEFFFNMLQFEQRRVADKLVNGTINFRHCDAPYTVDYLPNKWVCTIIMPLCGAVNGELSPPRLERNASA